MPIAGTGYGGPDFSPVNGGGSFRIPTFQEFSGMPLNDLISMLNGYKQSNASQQFGFQKDLLNTQLGEQGRQFNTGLAETGRQFDSSLGLDKSRLGEQGRQFDVGTQLERENEIRRQKYLDELLNFQRQQQIAERLRKSAVLGGIGTRPNNSGSVGTTTYVYPQGFPS